MLMERLLAGVRTWGRVSGWGPEPGPVSDAAGKGNVRPRTAECTRDSGAHKHLTRIDRASSASHHPYRSTAMGQLWQCARAPTGVSFTIHQPQTEATPSCS